MTTPLPPTGGHTPMAGKPCFHVMQRKNDYVNPGYMVVSTFRIADETELLSQLEESRLLHNQVLVAVNEPALSMLLRLSLKANDVHGLLEQFETPTRTAGMEVWKP